MINAVCLILMIMLGLYLFDDNIGLFSTLSAVFGSAENAVRNSDMPQVEWSWQLGLLGGVFFGSFCGALINGSFKIVLAVEDTSSFSGKVFKSSLGSLISGFLVMLGAIMAGDVLFGQVAAAMESGVEPITLGKRILRTETAGFTVLSWMMYQLEN